MRKNRLLIPDAVYHVTMRANRKEMILDPSGIKELYLSVLKAAKGKYAIQIHNFCIMGNHVHIIIKPGHNESLSAIMQWINSVFASRYNRLMGRCGHVWGERFFSAILHSLSDYLRAIDYVDENPVAAHLSAGSSTWMYGGLRHSREGRYDVVGPPDALRQLLYPGRLPLLIESAAVPGRC